MIDVGNGIEEILDYDMDQFDDEEAGEADTLVRPELVQSPKMDVKQRPGTAAVR